MRVNVPLIGELAIIQGETYQALSLEFPGDKTTWTPRGQIRTKLLQDSGTLLSEFYFATPAYDAESDTTKILPRLTPAQTAAIPKTKWQGTGEYSKTAIYYYDIELESDAGEVVKTVPAIVQVVGEVTGSGTPPPSTMEVFLTASGNLSELTDASAARSNLGIVGGVKSDWNASPGDAAEILNKPAIPNVNDYETTAQLNARDIANRDRTNHTGFQSISTITGLESALTGILKAADIGVDIQPFNANTVIDSNYVATENSYTTVEKNKLAGIEAGAQANVTPSWDDVTGKPVFGTAATTDSTDYATAAQGAKADTALQSDSLNNTALTGIPTAPTAPEGTNTTQLATTAFVLANGGGGGLSNPIDTVFQSIQTVAYGDGGNSTLDNSTHNVFSLIADGVGTVIVHSNVPVAGNRYGFELHLDWVSGTITWPASWTKGDSPPTAVGDYVITGVTVDGGLSFKVAVLVEG